MPLWTVQRRGAKIERSSTLKKVYQIDFKQFGLRRNNIMVTVSQGDCVLIVRKLDKTYGKNVLEGSITRGSPKVNVVSEVVYHYSDWIFDIIYYIKRIECVCVLWPEIIKAAVKKRW